MLPVSPAATPAFESDPIGYNNRICGDRFYVLMDLSKIRKKDIEFLVIHSIGPLPFYHDIWLSTGVMISVASQCNYFSAQALLGNGRSFYMHHDAQDDPVGGKLIKNWI